MFILDASASPFDHVPEPRPLVIIIGGELSRPHTERLEQAMPHVRIRHFPTRHADSSSRSFDRAFREGPVALVIVVSGLCRTQHVKDALRMARAHGAPWCTCRRLPHPTLVFKSLTRCSRGGTT